MAIALLWWITGLLFLMTLMVPNFPGVLLDGKVTLGVVLNMVPILGTPVTVHSSLTTLRCLRYGCKLQKDSVIYISILSFGRIVCSAPPNVNCYTCYTWYGDGSVPDDADC